MEEMERDFFKEVISMRLEIAYQKKQRELSRDEAAREKEIDDNIDELYEQVKNECTEKGKGFLRKYSDEVAYRESYDADFFYESGFKDGVALMMSLSRFAQK